MRSVLLAFTGFWLATTQADAGLSIISQFDLNSRPGLAPTVGGAYLGMTLSAWEGLPRPPSLSSRAAPSCSESSADDHEVDSRAANAERRGQVVCSYLARYGAVTLTQSLRLSPKYLLRNPQYTFAAGRLSTIRFVSSTDAFASLMAQFIPAYGAPVETIRDEVSFGTALRLPRVQKVWHVGGQWLLVTDPAKRPDRLEVELTDKPPKAPAS